ncbi:MAG TPA: right-handed parallel beta-helix repeat-containing protein, partial [Verrucomicrobiae bacterium]|nr:right-handed parallel beta-helix repeat-containing protein [Verrucomicrobiae bacterium]
MNAKWLGAVLLSCLAIGASEVTVTVGPRGDANSIEEGLDKLRAKRKEGDSARLLISGTQYLTKPIALTEKDSNTTIEGLDKGATLSGGRVLKGFKKGQGNLWELEIPDVKESKWYFRQLFVNGQRRQRARTPNSGYFRVAGGSPQDKPIKLKFKRGDIKKEWANEGDVEVVGFFAWSDIRMQIRAVDEAANVATLSGDPRSSNREDNAQYFIENAPDGLDAPGEWYLNRKTGALSYWPLSGEDLTKVEVMAPALEELVAVRGNVESKKAAERITFRNLTFTHTDYRLATNGYADTQAAVGVRGDLLFEFAKDCIVERSVFAHLGGYGIEIGRGGQNIKIRQTEVVDVGGGGVRIGETARRDDPFDANHSNEVSDCELHKLGRIFAPAIGVFILQSGTNLVSHNHIHDLYYTAVSVGWNWGYQETPCRGNVVEFNHMHDIGQNLLSDMGAVYTLGIQHGTVVRNNLIHDVSAFTYGGWGLYTDEGSSDILLENNVVHRCKSAGFHQHYG